MRQALEAAGMSLNEYVVSRAVSAAARDLAVGQVLAVSPQAWEELEQALDRPPAAKPRLSALLAGPSILGSQGSGRP